MELFKDCIKFVITRAFFVLFFNVTLCHEVFGYDQCYYVSSTIGSNSNDGLTELTPMKDLSKVPKENAIIRLKCDDVFWGGLSGYKNCVIESYGKGAKPVICGFKVLINPEAWKQVEEELWELDLTSKDNFAGNLNYNSSDMSINNIGFIYDASKDKVYGCNKSSLDSLKNEMDFLTSSFHTKEMIEVHPFKSVVVKCKQNPSELGNLCFPMSQSGIYLMTECKIRGVAIVGFSKSGLSFLRDCVVDDCQIDLIGGAIHIGHYKWTRYGNGVELWYNYCNNTIQNCLISRTFDCATTIQANDVIKSNPHNIHFIGNRIYKCRQAFEHFLNPSDGSFREYENCEFSNNICFLMGDNEFDSPELRDCNILSYENKAKPIVIKNNIFYGGNHLDGTGIDKGMSKNVIYIFNDQYLYTRHWQKDRMTIVSSDFQSVDKYKKLAFDNSEIVILKRGSQEAKRVEKRILKKIAWKPINLYLERIIQKNESIVN